MNSGAAEWPIRSFAEVADYGVGRTPARANPAFWTQGGEGKPWVTISDMPAYGVVTATKESISVEALGRVFGGELVPAGTLIMSFKLTIGRVATLGIPTVHNEAIISIFPKPGIDQRFLGYYLSQVDYTQFQDRQIKGNTLNKSKIDRIPVPVPTLDEQAAIADVLDAVRVAMAEQRHAITVTDELRREVMADVFARGLRGRAQKESQIGPVPAEWDVVPLGALGRIGNGSTPKRSVPAYWTNGDFPWLTSAKVYDREIVSANELVTDTALRECHLPIVAPGAVLIAITGQGKTLGHCAVLGIEATVNQHIAYIQTDLDKAVPRFIRNYLDTQYDRLRQVAAGGGSTKGALTCAFLRSMPVPLPGIEEQREIVDLIDAVDAKLALHRRQFDGLKELFDSLLHQLMSGELRVGVLDPSSLRERQAEPEEVFA